MGDTALGTAMINPAFAHSTAGSSGSGRGSSCTNNSSQGVNCSNNAVACELISNRNNNCYGRRTRTGGAIYLGGTGSIHPFLGGQESESTSPESSPAFGALDCSDMTHYGSGSVILTNTGTLNNGHFISQGRFLRVQEKECVVTKCHNVQTTGSVPILPRTCGVSLSELSSDRSSGCSLSCSGISGNVRLAALPASASRMSNPLSSSLSNGNSPLGCAPLLLPHASPWTGFACHCHPTFVPPPPVPPHASSIRSKDPENGSSVTASEIQDATTGGSGEAGTLRQTSVPADALSRYKDDDEEEEEQENEENPNYTDLSSPASPIAIPAHQIGLEILSGSLSNSMTASKESESNTIKDLSSPSPGPNSPLPGDQEPVTPIPSEQQIKIGSAAISVKKSTVPPPVPEKPQSLAQHTFRPQQLTTTADPTADALHHQTVPQPIPSKTSPLGNWPHEQKDTNATVKLPMKENSANSQNQTANAAPRRRNGNHRLTDQQVHERLKVIVSKGNPHDKYRLVEKIRQGAFGVVYSGYDLTTRQLVAIKQMNLAQQPKKN
ncbi:Serine/threonine-protein kinase PAK 3 [Fasciolopsis buskii]|uniref:non-specific serine/threonine protein kinase n=1 Tax=Fasciolopsis buskii TaxID=27845 RepID=A0A8E0RP91_9TREM|nr:Serine/threonine-protein kinase PAK 3 [Fasciolopsis buski]